MGESNARDANREEVVDDAAILFVKADAYWKSVFGEFHDRPGTGVGGDQWYF